MTDPEGPTRRSELREQIDFSARRAERYDRSVWSLGRRDNRNHAQKLRILADALRTETGRVLEVGTGTGLHADRLLADRAVSYTGVDASAEMLDLARSRLVRYGRRVRVCIGDAEALPVPDGAFDGAFCTDTLHHLSDPARGLEEMVRVVRPGGRVAVMEPNWKFPSILVYSAITRREWNTFRINPTRLETWGRVAGLEDVRVEHMLYTPPAPRSWERFYDRVDAWAARIPGIKRLSIALFLSGTRR